MQRGGKLVLRYCEKPIGDPAVRPYREGDEEAINELHNRVFGEQRPLAVWRWKYRLSLPALDRAMVVAEREGQIVGFMGAVKRLFVIGQRSIAAFQYVDICVQPEHRHGGATFTRLYRALKDETKEKGGELIYGFPNPFSSKWGKRRLGWQDTVVLPILFKRLNWRLALRRRLHHGMLEAAIRPVSRCLYLTQHRLWTAARRGTRDIVVERAEHIDAGFDRLWEKAADHFKAIAVRDANYLRWRYQLNPREGFVLLRARRRAETVGFLVLKLLDEEDCRRGVILDVFAGEDGITTRLIGEAIRWCLREKADYVECAAVRSSPLYRSLVQAGFFDREQSVTFYYVRETLPRGIERETFEDERGWFMTWGDTDFLA